MRYFNPRPPWGGRRDFKRHARKITVISIHALRGEGDLELVEFELLHYLFQSTPSVGRATQAIRCRQVRAAISIHALRGEGDVSKVQDGKALLKISIHALRGEGDEGWENARGCKIISIHALRGEGDLPIWSRKTVDGISIHALRGEGDTLVDGIVANLDPFQSTPSVGRATSSFPRCDFPFKTFQSTPSVGRATCLHHRRT